MHVPFFRKAVTTTLILEFFFGSLLVAPLALAQGCNWDGCGGDSGDYFTQGVYLSSGKLLIVITLVVIMIIAAFNEGRKHKDD